MSFYILPTGKTSEAEPDGFLLSSGRDPAAHGRGTEGAVPTRSQYARVGKEETAYQTGAGEQGNGDRALGLDHGCRITGDIVKNLI